MSVGWTKAEYDRCPELAGHLHSRILDLEDEVDALRATLTLEPERSPWTDLVDLIRVVVRARTGQRIGRRP